MESYREGISEEELANTRNYLANSYTQNFETLWALTSMLGEISLYGLPVDYVMAEQEIIRNITVDRHRELAKRYIDPNRMYYVVVGDAATQAKPLEALGFGQPEMIKE
jgi:zinc protease